MIDYIGKEYKEFGRGPNQYDCLGLLIQIYKDIDIVVPDYAYKSPEDIEKNQFIFDSQESSGMWCRVDDPQLGDVVMFKVGGFIVHIGIMLNSNQFIHAHKSCGVGVEKINSIRWKNRLHGYYRHNHAGDKFSL